MKKLHLLILALIIPVISIQWTNSILQVLIGIVNLSKKQTQLIPKYPQKSLIPEHETYDFIIAGAGASGSALANRLSEIANISVLLLEYGEEPSFLTEIPLIAYLLGFTDYDYGYTTQPQEHFCKSCENHNLKWMRGKALGGSTAINLMMATRGNRRDYDRWAAAGNPSWSYDQLLPYFKKIEDCLVPIVDKGYRGKGGPIPVTIPQSIKKITDVFINATLELGYTYRDPNGEEQLGVSYLENTIKNGVRYSAEKSYLRPIRKRKNLTIRTKSRVTKVLLNAVSKAAEGVEYIHSGVKKRVYARSEVILSTGSLNTPQILIMSGIGPKQELKELGIPLIQDLPVGEKIYDHIAFPMILIEVNDSITLELWKDLINPSTYLDYEHGDLALIGAQSLLYLKTNVSDDPDEMYPDIEVILLAGSISADLGILFRKVLSISQDAYEKFFTPYTFKRVFQIFPLLLHPKSHGYMKLNKSDPLANPLFYANYLSDQRDIRTLTASVRIIQKIVRTPAMQKYNAKFTSVPLPGCEHEEFDSDAYWECGFRNIISSFWHMTTTCKMGPANDPEAIVDNFLKVYGINNLRVVDASVIPFALSCHTMLPSYVIGERAADIIKDSYGFK